tara:strand:+ start:1444 stop:1872 length:429 start_codon:yes stop_codon:yes gene_type:complete
MKWFLLLFLGIPEAYAGSIVPSFTTGQMESTSTSKTIIVETIVTENYRTGYSYSMQGTNIQPVEGTIISPDATYTNTQTVNGVSFQWVTPNLTTKPQWEVVEAGEAFSITENFLAPGLDATSTIQRTINTESTSTSLSIFSQ